MSMGFKIFNAAGVEILSSSSYGFSIIDSFSVAASSSGSKTYEAIGDVPVKVVQTQNEPTTTSRDTLLSFSGMSVSVSVVENDLVISWAPKYATGLALPVTLYVLSL